MPELPEIETLVQELRPAIVGKSIIDVHAGQPKAINLPFPEFRERVRGMISAVDRHGKSAILRLPEGSLWLHLGLGGTVQVLTNALWPTAKFLSIQLTEHCQLAIDKVYMGHAHFVAAGDRTPDEKLGIDALDPLLTAPRLAALLQRKPNITVKAALMDQALLAGIGNTYADEILLDARIHPARRVSTLTGNDLGTLQLALRNILERAIVEGGAADFNDLDGRPGRYRLTVHKAQHCGVCATAVARLSIGGRTGYFCPACQPAHPGS